LQKQITNSENKERLIEGNVPVLVYLGIYSEDPEEDERINEELRKFLEPIWHKVPGFRDLLKDNEELIIKMGIKMQDENVVYGRRNLSSYNFKID